MVQREGELSRGCEIAACGPEGAGWEEPVPGSSLEGQHWTTQVFDYSSGGGPGGGAWRPGLLRAFLLRSGQSSHATIGGAQKVAVPAEGWEPWPLEAGPMWMLRNVQT